MNTFAPLVAIARSQLGVAESPRGSNQGTAIQKYKASTTLDARAAWPWCAAFVDWCIAQFWRQYGNRLPASFKLPKTAGAFALADVWAIKAGCQVWGPSVASALAPELGDIVVYTFSHVGIVSGLRADGSFDAIEGNKNDQVDEVHRKRSDVRDFIRLPQSRDYWEGML